MFGEKFLEREIARKSVGIFLFLVGIPFFLLFALLFSPFIVLVFLLELCGVDVDRLIGEE